MGALRCNHERIAHQPGSPAQRVARRDLRVSMSHGVGMSLRAVGLMRRRHARSSLRPMRLLARVTAPRPARSAHQNPYCSLYRPITYTRGLRW